MIRSRGVYRFYNSYKELSDFKIGKTASSDDYIEVEFEYESIEMKQK